ncbi:Uncharacterised protein [Vibrio cholerae]|nr:Uncharacterised protein [Vibrio cholerae]
MRITPSLAAFRYQGRTLGSKKWATSLYCPTNFIS